MRNLILFATALLMTFASCKKDDLDDDLIAPPVVTPAPVSPDCELIFGEFELDSEDLQSSDFVEVSRDTLAVASNVATTTVEITSIATLTLTENYIAFVDSSVGSCTQADLDTVSTTTNFTETTTSTVITEVIDNPNYVEPSETSSETNDNSSDEGNSGSEGDNGSEGSENASEDTPAGNGGGAPAQSDDNSDDSDSDTPPADSNPVTPAEPAKTYDLTVKYDTQSNTEKIEEDTTGTSVLTVAIPNGYTVADSYNISFNGTPISTNLNLGVYNGAISYGIKVVENANDVTITLTGKEMDKDITVVVSNLFDEVPEVVCSYEGTDVESTDVSTEVEYTAWGPLTAPSDVASITQTRTKITIVTTTVTTTTSYTKSDESCDDKDDEIDVDVDVETSNDVESRVIANPAYVAPPACNATEFEDIDVVFDEDDYLIKPNSDYVVGTVAYTKTVTKTVCTDGVASEAKATYKLEVITKKLGSNTESGWGFDKSQNDDDDLIDNVDKVEVRLKYYIDGTEDDDLETYADWFIVVENNDPVVCTYTANDPVVTATTETKTDENWSNSYTIPSSINSSIATYTQVQYKNGYSRTTTKTTISYTKSDSDCDDKADSVTTNVGNWIHLGSVEQQQIVVNNPDYVEPCDENAQTSSVSSDAVTYTEWSAWSPESAANDVATITQTRTRNKITTTTTTETTTYAECADKDDLVEVSTSAVTVQETQTQQVANPNYIEPHSVVIRIGSGTEPVHDVEVNEDGSTTYTYTEARWGSENTHLGVVFNNVASSFNYYNGGTTTYNHGDGNNSTIQISTAYSGADDDLTLTVTISSVSGDLDIVLAL